MLLRLYCLISLTDAALRVVAPRNHHAVLAHARDLIGFFRRYPADNG